MSELNCQQTLEISRKNCLPVLPPISSSIAAETNFEIELKHEGQDEEELAKLFMPNVDELPSTPPSAVEANFTTFYAPDFMKPGYDQYVHRHANGLCVVGLASSHVVFKEKGEIDLVDFNVGKSDRSGHKVTGKRKKNAQQFEPNTALCKVGSGDSSYVVRCCVKGSLLEVNERLIKQPELLKSVPEREGYIAIIMPRPADWLKAKAILLSKEEYTKLRLGSIVAPKILVVERI